MQLAEDFGTAMIEKGRKWMLTLEPQLYKAMDNGKWECNFRTCHIQLRVAETGTLEMRVERRSRTEPFAINEHGHDGPPGIENRIRKFLDNQEDVKQQMTVIPMQTENRMVSCPFTVYYRPVDVRHSLFVRKGAMETRF